VISLAGRFSIRRSSQSHTVEAARLLKRSVTAQTNINAPTILLCFCVDCALTAPPRKEPVLKAARNVVIKLAQTKMEFPKKGASTRDATNCRPMLNIPRRKTRANKMPVIRFFKIRRFLLWLGACRE